MRTCCATIVLTLLASSACGSNESSVAGPPDPPQEVRVPTLLRLEGTARSNGVPWPDAQVTLGQPYVCVFNCDDYSKPEPYAQTLTGPDGFWSLTYEMDCVREQDLGVELWLAGGWKLEGFGRFDERAVICTDATQVFDSYT